MLKDNQEDETLTYDRFKCKEENMVCMIYSIQSWKYALCYLFQCKDENMVYMNYSIKRWKYAYVIFLCITFSLKINKLSFWEC